MKRNKIRTNFVPALLLAAALGIAGCSQSEDTPAAVGATARGGEPIHISIAPKPGFAPDAPGTRATVADDGTFAWESGSSADEIYLLITFNDAASTRRAQTLHYSPGQTVSSCLTDWKPSQGWKDGGADDTTPYTWPVGASSATVQAFYTDCKVTNVATTGGDGAPVSMTFDYTEGTGDHMFYTKTIAPGEGITIDFKHATTRLVFKGLTANTAYSLNVNGTPMTYPTSFTVASFSTGTLAEQTFTSDADGKLVICAALDDKIDANGKVTLELLTGGVSAGTTELTAKGAAGAYKMDGYMYTVTVMSNSGGGLVDPDNNPDLLPVLYEGQPAKLLALPGCTAYWVAPVDIGGDNTTYEWTKIDFNTVCPEGWKAPSKDDIVNMTGIDIAAGSTQGITTDNWDILSTVFPKDRWYWTSTEIDASNVWYYYVDGGRKTYIDKAPIASAILSIRCVKKK